ncbi:MAG: armadillo-type protein, partial [Olpidium bornovanus]
MAPTAEKKEAREKEGGKQDKAKEKEKDKDKGEKEKGPKEKDKEAAAATAGAAAAGGAENRAASEEEKMTPVTAVLNEVGTVILLLASAEPVVQATALAALEGYADASHKNRVSLLNQHVLIPVLELTNSPDAAVRKNAVGCIAALSDAADVHPDLRKEDLIRQLVSLLNKNEAVDVIEDAAYALSNVAKDFANKVEIRKHGGMKALIH